MSKITLDEYLKKQREIEEFTLPSGLVVKIRKRLSPIRLLKILGRSGVSWEDLGTNLSIEQYRSFCEEGFKELLIEPKVPDDITPDDFTTEDFTALHKRLMEEFRGRIDTEVQGLGEKDLENKDFTTPSG